MIKSSLLLFLFLVCSVLEAQEIESQQEAVQPKAEDPSESAGGEKEQGIRHIAAADAINNVGKTLAVCGTVAAGVYNRRSQTKNTYLNFDKPFPDSTFTAIIPRKNRKYFKYKPEKLEGKWVCTYGLITEYQGGAEVNVLIPEQIIAKEYPE
jgi:hypothetical protein